MSLEKTIRKSSTKELACKDYLVSNETFDLFYNEKYHLLFTKPVPKNLSKYYESDEYISHSDKQRGLIPILYGLVRRYSLIKKERIISSFAHDKKLLDVGAGSGAFINHCIKEGWRAVGTEPSEKARNIAKKNGTKIYEDLFSIQKETFSIITLWHVLEHIEDLTESITKIASLLDKEGRLLIAVPNFESFDATHYKEYWAAYDVPRHLWHFSKQSISKIFSEFDFEVIETRPMKFDSYYVSLLSEKHKTGKSNFLKAFWIGLLSNLKGKQKNNYSSIIYVLKKKNKEGLG